MRDSLFRTRAGSISAIALSFVIVGRPPQARAAQLLIGDVGPPSAEASTEQALPLTLERAQALARQNNPTLQAAQASIRLPEAQRRQALRYSNPILSLGVLPGLNAGTGLSLSVAKAFEVAGQRGPRRDASSARVEAARFEAADVERTLRESVARAFYGVRVSQELEQRVDSVVAATARLVDAARFRYRAGLAPELDVNIARIQLLETRVQRARASRERTVRSAELNTLLGRPADAALRVQGPLVHQAVPRELSPPRLEDYARRFRADAQAISLTSRAAAISIDLARRAAVPDLLIGLGLNRDADGIRTVGLSAGFSLPLFDRNQLGLDQARAQRAVTAARVDATDLAISREVRAGLASLDAARTELSTYADEILPIAEQNQDFAAAAYARGELGITSTVLAQQQFADAQVGYLRAVLAFDQAAVQLERAVGAPLTRFDQDPTNEEGGR